MDSVSPALLTAAEAFVRQALAGADASHDWAHVSRVRANALRLAAAENLPAEQQRLAELSALLHDVEDYKYSGSETAAGIAIAAFMVEQQASPQLSQQVQDIVAAIGFKDELAGGTAQLSPVAAVVQDADRLDAIGAIGIARCFTYGGRFGRTLYDLEVAPREGLTKEQYMSGAAKANTINHFHEKLLKLKDLMKTAAGREVAQERHRFMVEYLRQFEQECQGAA